MPAAASVVRPDQKLLRQTWTDETVRLLLEADGTPFVSQYISHMVYSVCVNRKWIRDKRWFVLICGYLRAVPCYQRIEPVPMAGRLPRYVATLYWLATILGSEVDWWWRESGAGAEHGCRDRRRWTMLINRGAEGVASICRNWWFCAGRFRYHQRDAADINSGHEYNGLRNFTYFGNLITGCATEWKLPAKNLTATISTWRYNDAVKLRKCS